MNESDKANKLEQQVKEQASADRLRREQRGQREQAGGRQSPIANLELEESRHFSSVDPDCEKEAEAAKWQAAEEEAEVCIPVDSWLQYMYSNPVRIW